MPRRTSADPYALKIGERLRALRLEKNMSLADLANASELSKGHLSSVEHGLAAITIQTISKLAKGLGLSPLYILADPAKSDLDDVAELLRKLPPADVIKFRCELTKTAKEAAKTAKSQRAKNGQLARQD